MHGNDICRWARSTGGKSLVIGLVFVISTLTIWKDKKRISYATKLTFNSLYPIDHAHTQTLRNLERAISKRTI